ncbi:MAG: membrane protein insertase YidC [Clostridiales bacterium]|nr:membrane protein insertase YidC [Clostridiales bacterium]
MNIISALAAVGFPLLEDGFQIPLNWLENFIRILIEGIGITGVGIIVFTLILKAITLPFDIYQRVKMRKQTLVMRSMKEDLDKLQKQYANDKTMYQQKMMELYKKNGYSPLAACLPIIVSFVILIVAFSSLNSYSQYANLNMYERMTSSYNTAILSNCELPEYDENGAFVFDSAKVTVSEETREGEGTFVVVKAKAADKFMFYEYNKDVDHPTVNYYIDTDKLYTLKTAEIDALVQKDNLTIENACYNYVRDIGAEAAAKSYHDNPPSFLWIKNIWYPDVSYNHPIQTYDEFIGTRGMGTEEVVLKDGSESTVKAIMTVSMYENITAKLDVEKDQANGFFILIILSIGLMVLSQFITMKSSKESNQYQTVDGRGANTQKIMLFMMPLIYAIFAFMYSAAFSIYMAMSSLVGILVTVLSNLILGRTFKKKEEAMIIQQNTRTLPWMKNQNGGKNNKNKKNK